MATLHKVAEVSKKIIIGFSIGIGSLIFFAVMLKIYGNIKEALFPTPPPPPTVRYGKLPALPFSQSNANKSLSYSLDTLSGKLPTFSNQIEVYKIFQPQPNLLSFDNVKSLLAKNNFTTTPTAISETQYLWKNNDSLSTTLTYDTLTSDFQLTSGYLTDQKVLSAQALPNPQDAISLAKSFLTNFQSFPSDIDETKTTTTLLAIKNGQLAVASSFSNAQIIEVDFYQNDIKNTSIFYPNFPKSTMRVLVASGDQTPIVVEAEFFHKIIISDDNSTYPIKSPMQAFEDLKNGKSYISNSQNDTKVLIKNVALGYYLGENPQKYLYPIIIFEGDNNFYAYVNAVKDEWIEK